MPYKSSDPRYQHLPLPREEEVFDRRKRAYFPKLPPCEDRSAFGGKLEQAVARIESEASQRPAPPAGVQPHLVFRVPLTKDASPAGLAEKLSDVGLTVVSIQDDNAIVVFRDDADLSHFRDGINAFKAGPRPGVNPKTGRPYTTTQWDVLLLIDAEQMRSWSQADRIGDRLKEEIGPDAAKLDAQRTYIADVELWHRGTKALAQATIDELQTLLNAQPKGQARMLDSFPGNSMCLARVSVSGAVLSVLLDTPIVASVDLPAQPALNPAAVYQTTKFDLPTPRSPARDGPRLCILDSGVVSNHPLLAPFIGHAEAFLTQTSTPADECGHGTAVAGVAVFGDVRRCLEAQQFSSPITLYSARILNERNKLDDAKLFISQVRLAVETFKKPPYNCRIFNLSFGSTDAAASVARRDQFKWAEAVDTIAVEEKVLFVVSAGNNRDVLQKRTDAAEAVLTGYPDSLFGQDARLNDPGASAIALTVGALAEHDGPFLLVGQIEDSIARPVAQRDQPSPFTRTGPGIGGAVKPDLVHYGCTSLPRLWGC
jgi:hypothetical protein